MNKPELYSKGKSTRVIHESIFQKYGHFIRWGNPPESIIEIGIGDGNVTKEVIMPILPNNIEEYVGCDLSKEMVEFSRTMITHPKYRCLQMDICSAELPAELHNRFDKVFACCLLHMASSKIR